MLGWVSCGAGLWLFFWSQCSCRICSAHHLPVYIGPTINLSILVYRGRGNSWTCCLVWRWDGLTQGAGNKFLLYGNTPWESLMLLRGTEELGSLSKSHVGLMCQSPVHLNREPESAVSPPPVPFSDSNAALICRSALDRICWCSCAEKAQAVSGGGKGAPLLAGSSWHRACCKAAAACQNLQLVSWQWVLELACDSSSGRDFCAAFVLLSIYLLI